MLAGAVDEPDADPGLGEVGGLLAVLLASLEQRKSQNQRSELDIKDVSVHSGNIHSKVKPFRQVEMCVWKILCCMSVYSLQVLERNS